MQATLVVSCVIFCIYLVDGLNYRDCGSSIGTLLHLNVSGCYDQDICPLKRGGKVEIVIRYKVNDSVQRIKPDVKGKLGILPPVPFNYGESDGCQSTQPSCPLRSGDISVYRSVIPVKNWYPLVPVDVFWALQDEKKRNIVCVVIPSKVEQ